ncbi:hypothetical protein DTO271D3_2199 [Paecilomyces variotii]|nr:hypothetical protein DTO271D3_2199 [Paecilomyces variotii]KAJ9392029.1 hypothetical protein DTO063F5_788 [Paecilomyces variotii]
MDRFVNVYILTFNCARILIETDFVAEHFFHALPQSARDSNDGRPIYDAPEIIVLSLQEIAPISYAFLGGSFLTAYFDAFRRALDLAVSKQWGSEVDYVEVIRENSGMTAMMVFVRSDVSDRISWTETAQVGVGVLEMGNKGAVGTRLGYMVEDGHNETVDLTFVAAHLAPMEEEYERRNEDWKSIVERLVFAKKKTVRRRNRASGEDREERIALLSDETSDESASHSGIFAPGSHLFVAGDLNYRTCDTSPSKDDHRRFPQPTADVDSPRHFSHLLKNDQLTRELQRRKTLHGLSEELISFPPTYKYSALACLEARLGDTQEWKWAKHRWPSWCDRILYLDLPPGTKERGHVQPHVYSSLPLFPTSDHRAVALSVSVLLEPLRGSSGIDQSGDVRPLPPFQLDPNWESRRAAARTKELIVGFLAYLSTTWEGLGLLLATGIGAAGGWLVLRSILED